MKRSNDYAQGNDAFKKPRVAQGYNNYPSHGGMGASSADIYGGGYGTNPMMMGGYGQMAGGGQYGSQFGIDPVQSLNPPFQQYPAPAFGAPYSNAPFQVSFPPNANAGAPGNRTVYIGNVSADVTIDEVLNLVRCGLVESARLLPEKSCAFISFVDSNAAASFHLEASTRRFNLGGQDVRVGWGKPSAVPPQILQAIQQGATRNVFLGNVDDSVTEQNLRADFSQFGTIDTVRVLHEKNIAFVHFTSVNSAMKAVASLPHDPRYSGRRVNYGKDRCAKNAAGGPNNLPNSFAVGAPAFPQYGSPMAFNPSFDRFPGGRSGGMGMGIGMGGGGMGMGAMFSNNSNTNTINSNSNNNNNVSMSVLTAQGNRTVYLGGIGPDTTCEDLCNTIRGGILNSIRYLPAKNIAFVSFVDPEAANNFYNQAHQHGISIKNRRLKVGWGQNAHALPPPVIQALQDGATRNVYVGAIDASFTEDRLRHDFAEFGEIELVNILPEKNCGFVNFTNILSAVKAVECIKNNPSYDKVKVNFGKDRCGNVARPNRHNNSNGHSHGHGNGNNHGQSGSHGSHGRGQVDDNPDSQVGGDSQADPVKIDDLASDVKDFEEDDEMFQVVV
ncbi:hypothetical protein BGZ75_004846 [Mortierella antarctica]|nr:hypothetical protein BGZ75_004846 [Mortierella antarctica]